MTPTFSPFLGMESTDSSVTGKSGAHDDDALRKLRAVVLEGLVVPARDLPDHVHVLLDDLPDLEVVCVRLLDLLEEDVRALRRPALILVRRDHAASQRQVVTPR